MAPTDVPRSEYHEVFNRSYAVLLAARAAAHKKRQYNSEATRDIITQECIKRVHVTPYPEQLDLAECMLLGVDAISIAGTGWGKTLPFVLPLFVPETKGKMIIILSPLNALEMDQAERFEKMGLSAVAINGETNTSMLLTEVERGKYTVVILGPKLLSVHTSRVRALFGQPRFTRKILGLVIDEAHCITQWGSDFRPEYAELGDIRALMPVGSAVHATSATMPPPVLHQVGKTLLITLSSAFILNLGNDRPNITWEVRYMSAGKSDLEALAFIIPANSETLQHLPKTMVFFDDIMQSMRARRWVLARLPEHLHDRVKGYHSRRSPLAKSLVMRDFQMGAVDMLFTTEAAGMGCDIRRIAHSVQYMAPDSLSTLVQRAGRAGREPGMQARATLLVQPSVFQEMGKKTRKEGEAVVYKKEIEPGLRKWVMIPEDQCRRDVADEYFGNPPRRHAPTGECCDNCTRRAANLALQASSSNMRPTSSSAHSATTVPTAPQDTPPQNIAGPTNVEPVDLHTDASRRFAFKNWREFLSANRSESDIMAAKELLSKWRHDCWDTHYAHQPYGSVALLPDPMFSSLATRTSFKTPTDLLELKWHLAERHGPEVLALLEPIDRRAGLEKLLDEKEKYDTAVAAKMAKEEERRAREDERARLRTQRERERERERLRKEAEAAQRKQDMEAKKRKRAQEREQEETRKRRAAAERAATRAIRKIADAQKMGGPRTKVHKRQQEGGGEPCPRPTKRLRTESEKENVVVDDIGASGVSTAQAHKRPQPRPRPRSRLVPPAPSTPFTAPLEPASTSNVHWDSNGMPTNSGDQPMHVPSSTLPSGAVPEPSPVKHSAPAL